MPPVPIVKLLCMYVWGWAGLFRMPSSAMLAGNTPLHIAAGRKMKDIVALLMAYGANPSITNSEGDIPHDLPPAVLVSDITLANS